MCEKKEPMAETTLLTRPVECGLGWAGAAAACAPKAGAPCTERVSPAAGWSTRGSAGADGGEGGVEDVALVLRGVHERLGDGVARGPHPDVLTEVHPVRRRNVRQVGVVEDVTGARHGLRPGPGNPEQVAVDGQGGHP